MRIAIFSDVPANLPALEAVLADIDATGVDGRYALSDASTLPTEFADQLREARGHR